MLGIMAMDPEGFGCLVEFLINGGPTAAGWSLSYEDIESNSHHDYVSVSTEYYYDGPSRGVLLHVDSNAATPDMAKGMWRACDCQRGQWIDVPGLRVQRAEPEG